jgi:hypothetical protein
MVDSIVVWANRWLRLAKYEGSVVPDVDLRIEQLIQLWQQPIPAESWQRTVDVQLHGEQYRRVDREKPHPGEHAIEHEILCCHFESVSCFGNKLLDGVNALPLVRTQRVVGKPMWKPICFCLQNMVMAIACFFAK